MENSLSNSVSNIKKGLFEQKGGTLGMILLAIGILFFMIKLPVVDPGSISPVTKLKVAS